MQWRDGYLQPPFPGAPEIRHWLQVTRVGSRRCLSLHVMPATPGARRLLRSVTGQAATLGQLLAALRQGPDAMDLRREALRQQVVAEAMNGDLEQAVGVGMVEQQQMLDAALLGERERQQVLFGPLDRIHQQQPRQQLIGGGLGGVHVVDGAAPWVGPWRTPPDPLEPVGYRSPGVEALAQLLVRYCGPYALPEEAAAH